MHQRFGRKALFAFVTLVATMLSGGAFAKIPTKAFKSVTRCFNSGKKQYSPTLGEFALETGLIYDLRFFGNFTQAYNSDGNRDYARDKSDDPFWNMVRIFFPSTGGNLSTESTYEEDFGKNVDKVETAALLQNFVNDLREGKDVQVEDLKESIFKTLKELALSTQLQELEKLKGKIDEIQAVKKQDIIKSLNSFKSPDNSNKNVISNLIQMVEKGKKKDELINIKNELANYIESEIQLKHNKNKENFKRQFLKKTLTPLIEAIQNAVKSEKTSLYPEHTVEQIISAFFCYHFNTQDDIKLFLKNLDDSMIDKSKIAHITDEVQGLDELRKIAAQGQENPYDMDDVLGLELADIWVSPTPYRTGSSPLSNGNTWKYDRKSNDFKKGEKPFADCVEIGARHLMNLLLFNPETREFDLSNVRKYVDQESADNPYFSNFVDFYKVQTPNRSNAGDIEMRSLWNKVVGDLNDVPHDPISIKYMEGNNELNAGFINLIKVFQKVFGLKVDPVPTDNFYNKKQWLHQSLEELFKALNPNKIYQMDLSNLKEDGDDISGNLPIVVGSAREKREFSFTFQSHVGMHSQILSLKNLIKSDLSDITDPLKAHTTEIKENTAEESIWLLSPSADLKKDKVHHPLYTLFSQELADNDSKVNFLHTLKDNINVWKDQITDISFKRIIENVLKEISWDDYFVRTRVTPLALELSEIPELQEVFFENVKGLYFQYIDLEGIKSNLKKFKNLEYLDIDLLSGSRELTLEKHEKLKELILKDSKIRKIKLDHFKSLEKLYLTDVAYLEELSLTELENLKKMDLPLRSINKLELDRLDNLETLDLRGADDLEKLSLKKLDKVKELLTRGSNLKVVELNRLNNLESLSILESKNLKKLSLNELEKLQRLHIPGSNVSEIIGLDSLKNLESLDLSNTKNIKKFSLNEFEKLERLNLKNTKNLEELSLNGLEKLTSVDLDGSGVKNINLNNLKSLESLFLMESKKLMTLSLSDLDNLKELVLLFSRVDSITLKNLKNIENLDLSNMPLKRVVFEGGFAMLKELTFESSDYLESIEGLEKLNNLRKLDLSDASSLKSITLDEANKELEIKGKTDDLTITRVRVSTSDDQEDK